MILIDSSVWIDYFRAANTLQTSLLDRMFGSAPFVVGDLILAEVLQGVTDEMEFARVKKTLDLFTRIDIAGHDIALKAAKNYRVLRARGVTVRKTIDTLIATRCIEDGLTLLYSDRDFDPFVHFLKLRSAVPLK